MIRFNKVIHEESPTRDKVAVTFMSNEHDTQAIVTIPHGDFFTESDCKFEGVSTLEEEYIFNESECSQLVQYAIQYCEDEGLIV